MPPKVKLYRNSGKNAPKINQPMHQSGPSTSTLNPEAIQQFELELCWCIQQLQLALVSGKLNNKQVQDHTKAVNTLMNNNAPIVKKRQIMRLSFGDYRAKMAEDAKKFGNVTLKVKQGIPSKKSMFVKKSTFTAKGDPFKFDFTVASESIEDSNEAQIPADHNDSRTLPKVRHYLPSDNSFRFSFDVEKEI